MTQVIVPAGLMLGEFHAADASDEQPEYWHLNVGGYAEQLTALETTVWAAAMADPQKQAKLKGTREALHLALRTRPEAPISDPAPVIDDLLSRRVLAEFDPVADNLETFGTQHRLLPLGIGLGNTHEDPENYRIAVAGEPRVSVNGDIYALWANSQHYPNLWESCAAFAKEAFDDEGPQPDTNSVLQALAANIPLLVATEVAVLDPILG